jgi:NADH-quinone oxidoreductase subunit A
VAAVFRDWVVTRGRGLFALAELAIFVGILAVGLVYVWAKGDLQWLKRLPRARHTADGGVREAA